MKIKAENICKEITIKVYIDSCHQYHPVLTNAVFECRSCLRIHEVPQPTAIDEIHEIYVPKVCTECGGHDFKLLKEESEFTDMQELLCHVESRSFTVCLRGCQCKSEGYPQGMYTIKGRLNVDLTRKPHRYYIDKVTDIRKNRK